MMKGNMKELLKLRREKRVAETKNRVKEQADYCNAIGVLLAETGDFEAALGEHQEELALCEALEDSIGQAVAHRKMGEALCELGRHRQALFHHTCYLEAAQRQHDRLETQRATATVGRTYLLMVDNISSQEESKENLLRKAEKWFQKSLQVVPSLTDVSERERAEMTARLHLNLGIVAETDGRTQDARAAYKKAAAVTERHGLLEDGRRVQDSLALSLQATGDYREALRHLDASLRLAERLQDRAARADTLHTRAQVLMQMGEPDDACRAWYKAYKLKSPRAEEHERHARCLRYAVRICRADDRLLLLAADDHQGRHRCHEQLGDWCCHLAAYRLALEHYGAQLQCAEALRRPESAKAAIYASLAETHKDLQQPADARRWYQRELAARHGNSTEVCKTLMNLASLEASMGGDVSRVCEFYRQAADEAAVGGLVRLQASALRDMADTYHDHGLLQDEERVRSDLGLLLRCNDLSDDWDETPASPRASPTPEDEQSDTEDEVDLDQLSDMSSAGEEADPDRPRRSRQPRQLWRNKKGETHLHVACIQGKHRQVARLLQTGHPVNVRDNMGWLPLHEAANFGHTAVVRLLVRHGAAVSDPGGPHCDGVTPLHDAAQNGHVTTARELLAAGAAVAARNAQGSTPLQYLMAYRVRSWSALTDQERDDIVQLEAEMKQALRKAGEDIPASPSRETEQRSPGVGSSEIPSQSPLPPGRSADRPPPLSDDETEDEEEEDVTTAYRQAIRAVGTSAVTGPATHRRGQRATPAGPRPSLVGEAEYDWLEQDVAAHSSRRRCLSPQFSGGGGRRARPVSPLTSTGRTRPVSPLTSAGRTCAGSPPFSDGDENGRVSLTIGAGGVSPPPPADRDLSGSPASPARRRDRETSPPTAPLPPSQEQEAVIEAVSSDSQTAPPPAARRSRKRPRQSRLTPLVMREQRRDGNRSDHEPSPSPSPTLPTKAHRTDSTVDKGASFAPTLRVYVEVERDRLMVPIPKGPAGQEPSHTIGWLAKEASDRYYRQFLMRPHLELCAAGSTVPLDAADAVRDVISGQDDVIGSRVTSWERPSLSDRYTSACVLLGDRVNAGVASRLALCQSSGRLDLSDLCLTPARLRPVLRAIQRYSCIVQLNLAGNLLKDAGVQELCAALPYLCGLEVLDLTLVQMSTVGLSHLAASVSEQRALQVCRTLSLGYNQLGDSSAGAQLAAVVAGLPQLACLDLTSCRLTELHVTSHGDTLGPALAESALSELRLAHNQLSEAALRQLLRWLRPDRLLRLQLAGNSWPPVDALLRFVSGGDCALRELDISCGTVTDEQAAPLASALALAPHLAHLDVSRNGRLTAAAAAALSAGCRLTQLRLAGCRAVADDDDGDEEERLCALLGRDALRCVWLPGDGARGRRLAELWTQRWRERAVVATTPDGDTVLRVRPV